MDKRKWWIACTYTKSEPGLRQCSGRFGDHGSSFSQKLRSVSSICFGISVRRYSKYSYGLRLFAFAVSAMLYMMALDFAPAMVSIITQFSFLCRNYESTARQRCCTSGLHRHPEILSAISLG